MLEPTKLVSQYETGVVTRHELLIRLCQAAVERPPEQLATDLPSDVLAEVRDWSKSPPDSPDKCRVIHMGSFIGGDAESWERQFRDESRRLFDGLWLWHRFFGVASPVPAPDPARDAGS
jgi:hypothetical protein